MSHIASYGYVFVLISFILWRKMPGLSAVNCLSSIAACFLPVAIATTSRNLYCIATFKQLVSRLQKRWVATSNCVCHLSYAQQASRNYYRLAIYTLQKLARRSSDRLHACRRNRTTYYYKLFFSYPHTFPYSYMHGPFS